MKLVPREAEKLALHNAGFLAQKRLARGLRLNYPEAIALIAAQILEFVRDGDKTVTDLMDLGKQMLGRRQVLPAVPYLLDTVQVEGTFMDGTKLITVHDPVCSDDGNLELALHGSYLPVPSLEKFSGSDVEDYPGEVHFCSGRIILNLHRRALTLKVVNKADRPIQIGSHYHFIEANPYLVFDRQRAYGMRLNIPAGTAVRFEPGDAKRVTLVSIGGHKVIRGGNGIADGAVDSSQLNDVIQKITENGFGHEDYPDASEGLIGDGTFDCSVDHEKYSSMYGPTTGDKIRLGDTDLYAEIEKDFAVYGDECIFGGGKVLRDGMGQSAGYPASASLDTVITNAVVIDYTGIYKADIGMKDGLIIAIGKAGNPDVMDGVHSNMIVGVNTEVIAAQGMIVTAGGIDCHVHFICPQLVNEAIASGITTLVGGGTGPAHGTCATTCTPAPSQMKLMLQSTDEFPINVGFTGKGNTAKPEGLSEIIKAGAMGLKLHEDWGSTPAAIDNCLSVAEAFDIQVNIHTDTLNEAGCVEHTIAAFKDRSIHTYHSEGAGGGHAPDIIKVCGVKNVLPSSTNPTRPFTSNTVDEHLDMLMVCHHLDKNIPEDVAFAESRIRAETIAAEDILHDMGAISIISSDSQAMGRIGEVIIRTWQTANKMKVQRGRLPGPGDSDPARDNDNFRIRRYIAKYTINPAIVSGFSDFVGSVEAGKLADLVLWKPAFFGAKPELIIKGGAIAWANMGDPNASIPTPEPVMMRPMFGAFGKAGSSHSIAFVSKDMIALLNSVLTYQNLQSTPALASFVRKSSITVEQALVNNRWVRDISGGLSAAALAQYLKLWDAVAATSLTAGQRDEVVWRFETSGEFSTSSAYSLFFAGNIDFACASAIWKAKAPPRLKFFMWLVVHQRCQTADNLERKGWPNQGACVLCSQESESCRHLFLYCCFTREVWERFRTWVGAAFPIPGPDDADTATWWLRAREAAPKQLRRDFDAVVILVHWRLWKERNSRIFDGVSMDTAAVLDTIIEELRTWRHAGGFASDLAI